MVDILKKQIVQLGNIGAIQLLLAPELHNSEILIMITTIQFKWSKVFYCEVVFDILNKNILQLGNTSAIQLLLAPELWNSTLQVMIATIHYLIF